QTRGIAAGEGEYGVYAWSACQCNLCGYFEILAYGCVGRRDAPSRDVSGDAIDAACRSAESGWHSCAHEGRPNAQGCEGCRVSRVGGREIQRRRADVTDTGLRARDRDRNIETAAQPLYFGKVQRGIQPG